MFFSLQIQYVSAKIQKNSHTRKAYTQKFTKCKILGAEIYEVQSFLAVTPSVRQFLHIVSVNFYTRGSSNTGGEGKIRKVCQQLSTIKDNFFCSRI